MLSFLLCASVVNFPGGSYADLARSIAEATESNVVFLAGGHESAPKFTYSPDDVGELARGIQKATKFRQSPGIERVFHHGSLGSWLFESPVVTSLLFDGHWQSGSPGTIVEKDGRYTIHFKSTEACPLEALPTTSLSKPFRFHWLFTQTPFTAWITEMPVKDFFGYLGKAYGGRLVEQKEWFYFDIDPAEIRRRALQTIADVMKEPNYAKQTPYNKAMLQLSKDAIASTSNQQIAEALESKESKVKFPIPAGMRGSIQALLQHVYQTEVQRRQDGDDDQRQNVQTFGEGGGRDVSLEQMARIDRRLIGNVVLEARFGVRLELATTDQLGRPGPTFRFP